MSAFYPPWFKRYSPKLGQSSRSRSQGQKSAYEKKVLFIMHLYRKYQSPRMFTSKDKDQIKVFQNQVKVQGQQFWYRMKGFFQRYLSVKYQHPIPYGSKDKAQVKDFSLTCDADTGVMTIAFRTIVERAKNVECLLNIIRIMYPIQGKCMIMLRSH